MERLTAQDWTNWVHMARRTLSGASQMIWQNREEKIQNNRLFAKVTRQGFTDEQEWANAITWSGAILLALSIEQSMKATAIKNSSDGSCRKTHDLKRLWDDLRPEDRDGVTAAVEHIRMRTRGTRLGDGPPVSMDGLTAIIMHHRALFESARYHLENKGKGRKSTGNLTENIPLWRLALAALEYASGRPTSP